MNEHNPYQAPQAPLTAAAGKIDPQTIIPWEDQGRQLLRAVAKHHRWMTVLYLGLLFLGGCSLVVKYLAGNHRLAATWYTLPALMVYFALTYHVYQLAKRVNRSVTPLISLLVMLLPPYSLVVPIFYHRRAVHFFAHFGIRLPLLGIRPTELDTQIAAQYAADQVRH